MASFTRSPFDHQQQQHQQRIQSLLDQKERIESELNELAFQSSGNPPPNLHHGRPRQLSQHSDVPRTYVLSGTPMSRRISSDRSHRGPPELSRSLSQRSGSAMARTVSRPSTSATIPFTNTGRLPPALHPIETRPDSAAIDSWTTRQDDPLNAYTFNHQPFPDVGEDPREFLSRPMAPVLSLSPTQTDVPIQNPFQSPLRHRLSTSSRRSQTFGIQTPSTPSTLTTATTMASDMSRQSSFCPEALESFQMMNVNSNTSMFSESNLSDGAAFNGSLAFQEPEQPKSIPQNEEQNILLSGAGGAGFDQFKLSPHTAPHATFQSPNSFLEREMIRSQSNDSTSSASSQSRAKLQLQKQNQLAARRLAPKAGSEDDSVSPKAPVSMIRIKSKDGSDNRLVTPIPKTPYQRPKHDRVFCEHCTEYPDGFRGPHELGRHHDRTHKDLVKKWVCMEPADGVISSQYRPVNPLSKCKACTVHKKKYGAYYNAAAHLRRAHFVPKPRGRSKSSKMEDKSEKRGGKGGGDWPPMTELKRWMKEVYEKASDVQQQQQDDEEDEEEFVANGEDETPTSTTISSDISAQALNFDQQNVAADIAMMDAYAPPQSTFDTQGMPAISTMSYDALNQGIDVSMLYDLNQTPFDSASGLMNDNMAFINPSFPFEDQTLGHEPLLFSYPV